MEYKLEILDLNIEGTRNEVNDLINNVYGFNFSGDELQQNINTRNGKSIFLGAYLEKELAGVIFYMSHEFFFNKETLYGHQICWVATLKNHRKKGLFHFIMKQSMVILKERGSAFLFGFPNKNSHPLFVNSLGFRDELLKKVNIPVKFFPSSVLDYYLNDADYQIKDSFVPNEFEIYEMKQKEDPKACWSFNSEGNFLWGKLEEVKVRGIMLKCFRVGGIQFKNMKTLKAIFLKLSKEEKVDYIQLIGTKCNGVWKYFKSSGIAKHTEPFIIYDLNRDTTKARFNMLTGIKDVF